MTLAQALQRMFGMNDKQVGQEIEAYLAGVANVESLSWAALGRLCQARYAPGIRAEAKEEILRRQESGRG